MKAIAYRTPGPIDREDALENITLEIPKPESRDLLDVKHLTPQGSNTILVIDGAGGVGSIPPRPKLLTKSML